eukprot:CAMPEP_0177591014 /NCGR_PEP_ID=MMETSP0419_2-20121207/7747_1 /TAXON_ID=582737 /ORGANISM="Tetraselmis sp., Strain GSL018" /LENGTH=309 /DNA_ID=CAMNT_0019081679 /DNA_START=71 /DNA_END=1000 /DNA_ORIENTATION=+
MTPSVRCMPVCPGTVSANADSFDALSLLEKSRGSCLATEVCKFFVDFESFLPIDFEKLRNFVCAVEARTSAHSYHNSEHLLDCVQFLHSCLSSNGSLHMISRRPLKAFASLLAMLVHDVSHPGLTNDTVRFKCPELYEKYGSESTIEQLHLDVVWDLFCVPELNFLWRFSEPERKSVFDDVEKLVLATDMARHHKIISACTCLESDPEFSAMALGVKLADLSHNLRPYSIHRKWVSRLQKEMELQGLSLGTDSYSLAKNQIYFLTTFVRPLLLEVKKKCAGNAFLEKVQSNLDGNIAIWEGIQSKAEIL